MFVHGISQDNLPNLQLTAFSVFFVRLRHFQCNALLRTSVQLYVESQRIVGDETFHVALEVDGVTNTLRQEHHTTNDLRTRTPIQIDRKSQQVLNEVAANDVSGRGSVVVDDESQNVALDAAQDRRSERERGDLTSGDVITRHEHGVEVVGEDEGDVEVGEVWSHSERLTVAHEHAGRKQTTLR